MARKSTKFRLFVVLSVVWTVIIILAVTKSANRYWDFADHAIPIIIFTAPVWIFWSSAWIWPSKFEAFFNSTSNSKELKQWVYVEESVAQTHLYYGVGGWAALIVLGLSLSPLKILVEFYAQDINLNDFAHIDGFVALYRAEEITNWVLAAFSLVTLYHLIKHKAEFQKMYLLLVVATILIPIVDAVAVLAVFDNADIQITIDDLFTEQEIIKQIALSITSILWLLYVLKSKRINITTRKRLRKKHMHLLKNQDGNA